MKQYQNVLDAFIGKQILKILKSDLPNKIVIFFYDGSTLECNTKLREEDYVQHTPDIIYAKIPI